MLHKKKADADQIDIMDARAYTIAIHANDSFLAACACSLLLPAIASYTYRA